MDSVPSPNIINEEKEYKTEEVQNYRKQECDMQFLVHWKEYRNKYNQWISETGLSHAREVIEDYWTKILNQNL